MLCEECIHKIVCRKEEGYTGVYLTSGLILDCSHFQEKDEEKRIKRKAKELIENIINKEFKQ